MKKPTTSQSKMRKRERDTPSSGRGGDRRSGHVYFETLPSAMRELRGLYNEVKSGKVKGAGVYRVNMQVGILKVWIDARKFVETIQVKAADRELVQRLHELENTINDTIEKLIAKGWIQPEDLEDPVTSGERLMGRSR